MSAALTSGPLDPGALLAEFTLANPGCGAVVSFTGMVRAEGGSVRALELDAYPGFTETAIGEQVREACARFALTGALVVHRIGRVEPGEAVVFTAAAALHRRAAFEAVDFLMDFLKSRAPFWKKSHESGGARWIEPSAQDYEDAARWDAAKEIS
jgi:molybdopterin synthase catalytic subunit